MYKVRIYSTVGRVREFNVKSYDYAIERINHYMNNWKFFLDATLAYFNGEFWEEVCI